MKIISLSLTARLCRRCRGIAGGLSEANPIGTIIGIIIVRVHTVIRCAMIVVVDNRILKVAVAVRHNAEKKEKKKTWAGWTVVYPSIVGHLLRMVMRQ